MSNKPTRTNADREPFPKLPFENDLMTPPPVRHVVLFLAGVAATYIVLIVLATRYFGWIP